MEQYGKINSMIRKYPKNKGGISVIQKSRKRAIRLGVLILLLSLLLPLLPNADAASLYTVNSTSSKTLAPGITQTIKTATYSDDTRPVKYYITTADINRSDVMVLNGYKDNNPSYNNYVSATVDKQVIASERSIRILPMPATFKTIVLLRPVTADSSTSPAFPGLKVLPAPTLWRVSSTGPMTAVPLWPF